MRYEDPKHLLAEVDELEESYSAMGDAQARKQSRNALYYESLHWRAGAQRLRGSKLLRSNYDPDAHDLRVVDNFLTPLILRVEAQTYPASMEVEVAPGDAATSTDRMRMAQSCEDLLNTSIDLSSFIGARRDANHGRSIMGDYCVGLSLEIKPRPIERGGRTTVMQDRVLKAFSFSPTSLVLDPFQTSRDLRDHDIIVYREAWTIHRLRREFGDAIAGFDVDAMSPIGQLCKFELDINEISEGRLFSQYRMHSRTKGAIVKQIHVKDESGRFSELYVLVDASRESENRVWINRDNPRSPFGGDGLPLVKYGAHRVEGSPWSKSDAELVIDDQNRANVMKTIIMRHLQRYAAHKWLVDSRLFKDEEAARVQMNNRIGGLIMYKGRERQHGAEPPQLVQTPAPSPMIVELADREKINASEKLSRPEITAGQTKSHVPDSTFQTALEQANQIGGMRVLEDVEADAQILRVVLGTQVIAVRSGSPTVVHRLREHGFESEDFMSLLEVNPAHPQVRIKVRQTSVRNRSHERRKSDLDVAMQNGAITPSEYRRALANDLDLPLLKTDGTYVREASRATMRIIAGEEWQPIPLGAHTDLFLTDFRSAMFDKRVRQDPMAKERLLRAINSQMQLQAQEAQLLEPQPPQGTPAPAAEAAPQAAGGAVTVADVLAGLSAA